MVQIIRVLVIVIFAASAAQAQQVSGFVEEMNIFDAGTTTPEINFYARGPIKGKVGWTFWSLTTKEWSEATGGLTYAPTNWLEFSWSIGLETHEKPFRHSPTVWMGKGRWSLLSIHEHGGSGYWYKYLGTFQATKVALVGIYSQRYVGTGPYAEMKLGRVSLWGTYAITDDKGVVGVRYNF